MSTKLYRQPLLGIIAFGVAALSQWLGHSLYALLQAAFGDYHYYAFFLTGVGGAVLVARGLNKSEIQATWMGFLGAQFIWVGWFELTFELYAEIFAFPEYVARPDLVSTGGANLLMATMPIMLTIFLLYGFFNRQTKCNLIRWFHRNLRMNPGMPTPDNGRSVARIVAMESIFVIWACYEYWLYVSYFGASETVMTVAYVAWAAWFVYIFRKLLQYPRVGPAFRYAIPVGIIGWGLGEMPSYMGLYDEFWLKPLDYPLTTAIATAVYAAGIVYLANPPQRSPSGGTGAAQTAPA